MKLFVLGEESADPKDWSAWSEYWLVVAEDEERAVSFAASEGCYHKTAVEVPMDELRIVHIEHEPNWGRDI